MEKQRRHLIRFSIVAVIWQLVAREGTGLFWTGGRTHLERQLFVMLEDRREKRNLWKLPAAGDRGEITGSPHFSPDLHAKADLGSFSSVRFLSFAFEYGHTLNLHDIEKEAER